MDWNWSNQWIQISWHFVSFSECGFVPIEKKEEEEEEEEKEGEGVGDNLHTCKTYDVHPHGGIRRSEKMSSRDKTTKLSSPPPSLWRRRCGAVSRPWLRPPARATPLTDGRNPYVATNDNGLDQFRPAYHIQPHRLRQSNQLTRR